MLGAFSTTVTSNPYLLSQKANAGPATLAPEINTLCLFIDLFAYSPLEIMRLNLAPASTERIAKSSNTPEISCSASTSAQGIIGTWDTPPRQTRATSHRRVLRPGRPTSNPLVRLLRCASRASATAGLPRPYPVSGRGCRILPAPG